MPTEIRVPDIGDFKEVAVIEILVKPGDTVKAEQSLISVESDKSTMEIPSPGAGVVTELKVKLGDKVAEGSLILLLESAANAAVTPAAPASLPEKPNQLSSSAPIAAKATTGADLQTEVVVLGSEIGRAHV